MAKDAIPPAAEPANPPAWLRRARNCLGVRERAGPESAPAIMAWARRLGARALGVAYEGDHVPWCGLFIAQCVEAEGLPTPPLAIRAMSWRGWGQPLDRAVPGAVLVFQRPGGGHVGFYEAEDDAAYHVLGGNQSDAVTIARVAKDRCVAIRWPAGCDPTGRPVLARADVALSRNEA